MKALRFPGISLALFVLVFLFSSSAFGQTSDPHITGIVTDPSKAIIRGAQVDLINVDTGTHYPAVTNNSGVYSVQGKVGNYRIEVEHAGFKTVIDPNIVLHTADALEINFEMAVGSASELVTVNGSATNDSPAVSMTVDREFVEDMPLNGRSFQDLIQLAPGTAAGGPGNSAGYYSINGQRTDANNFIVDGVSANLGGFNNFATTHGSALSGDTPSQTAIGTTQSLASIDSLQEFTIQTSGYTAEYGRNPGGQVQFTTRSGTNHIHGSLFEYLRNTAFDANSYSNNYHNDPKTAEHQNDFGGTVGGPLIVPWLYNGKDKSFYFFSYEGLRLLLPADESEYVPTEAIRSWASPNVQPFLNASPLPNPSSPGNKDGCTIPDPTTGQMVACDALFYYGYSYPSSLDNISARVDQNLGQRLHVFVRYADTPSSEVTGAEQLSTISTNTHTWTAGLTANITNKLVDDFRFNYSHDGEESTTTLRSIGGSVPVPRDLLIPSEYNGPYASGDSLIRVTGTSLNNSHEYLGSGTLQHQDQIVNSLEWTRENHILKFGADWRRLTALYGSGTYNAEIELTTLADIERGYATDLFISAAAPGQPVFDNLSLYAQDHWKVTPRLSVDYGLRWEFNPPPGPSNGHYPVTLTSSSLATAQLTNDVGTQPYKTNYHSLAPRFGFAWNIIPAQSHTLTVRGGVGIFFDTGQSAIGSAYTGAYPFKASRPTQTEVLLPASSGASAPPSLNGPLTPPYPSLAGISSPTLTLPYTEEWNLSLDVPLNTKNIMTVSYVGNNGRKLLFTQYLESVPGNPLFTSLAITNNASQSSYNALQIQDIGHIANGLDLIASFTYAHALDNASNENSDEAPLWGNSDVDLRRMLNLALNYEVPATRSSGWLHRLAEGWLLTNRFSTQSGYPLDIYQATVYLPDGSEAEYYPDLVRGVPIYLHGRSANVGGKPVPGNWRLNPAAFACVPTNEATPCLGTPARQGTLGRNYVRNPSFWALNTAVQRSFSLYDQLQLNFRAEAFNIFNHPNLGLPEPTLSSSTFGQLVEGDTITIGSSNALYTMGAARSLQFSCHLRF